MKKTLMITTLMIALASAFAETDVIPLPDATKRQMQKQTENAESKRQASKAEEEKVDVGQAKALAMYAPRPQYPFEARVKHLGGSNGGSGLFRVQVDFETGFVTSAKTVRSTGNWILDYASLQAFRQWRVQPGTVTSVLIPADFARTP